MDSIRVVVSKKQGQVLLEAMQRAEQSQKEVQLVLGTICAGHDLDNVRLREVVPSKKADTMVLVLEQMTAAELQPPKPLKGKK